jgi:hypothetical protein
MALNAFNDEYCDKFEGIHGELPHGKLCMHNVTILDCCLICFCKICAASEKKLQQQ